MLPAWFHNIQERHESLREPPPSAACGTRGLRTVGGGARVLGAGGSLDVPASWKNPCAHQPALLGWVFFFWDASSMLCPEHGMG